MKVLLKHADSAMYQAKKLGRNCYCYFEPSLQQRSQSRQQLIRDLQLALNTKQFEICYQPIADCRSELTHLAEASIQWRHPVLGIMEPEQFIPLAEESGLGLKIAEWFFQQVTQQISTWLVHDKKLTILLNHLPLELHVQQQQTSWLSYLKQLSLAERHLLVPCSKAQRSHYLQKITHEIEQCNALGFKINTDDFGTGYARLTNLQNNQLDFMKIKSTFIKNIGDKTNDLILSDAIIMIAHKLHINVLADHVDNRYQQQQLATINCDYIQGNFISAPLTAQQFEAVISHDTSKLYTC